MREMEKWTRQPQTADFALSRIFSRRANCAQILSVDLPSYLVVLETSVLRAVGGKPGTFVDDPADGRFADDVSGAPGRVSLRDVVPDQPAEIDLRPFAILAEDVQQILPHDVPVASQPVELYIECPYSRSRRQPRRKKPIKNQYIILCTRVVVYARSVLPSVDS